MDHQSRQSDPSGGSPSAREEAPSPAAVATGPLRQLFLGEARHLLAAMTDRLTELSMELGDGHGFEELAAQSHALYGSAALADLPELSLAGDVLERATELAASRARKDPDGAQLLVRTTIAALAPARQMIEAAQAGDRSGQRSLLRELLAAFPEELRSQLGRRVDQELTQETPREAGRVETRSSDESEQAMGEEDERGDTPGAAHVESQSPAKPQHGAGEDDEFTESLIGVFRGELVELLSGVPDAIAGLIDPDEQMNLCADLGRIFHTVKGSAGTIGLGEIQELARIVQLAFEQAAEDPALLPLHPTLIDEIRRPLCDLFVAAGLEAPVESLDRLRSAISEVGPEPSDLEASVPAPLPPIAAQDWDAEASPAVEPEIMEAFQLDADAALEASEAALLALERDPNDRGSLRTLFRQFHTLKGAAAAVGLDRIAQQLHAGEAVLERALEETPGGATEALVQLLLELLDSIHGLLKELQGIPHEHRVLEDVDARTRELLLRSAAKPPEPIKKQHPLSVSRTTSLPPPMPPDPETAIVRVHASRLDLLMNRISELVVSRTRMDDSMSQILETRDRLSAGRVRLNETIESFRGFEFAGSATGPATGESPGAPAAPDDFTDLEFDKYDDFNVLTRTLVELAGDASEMLEQLSGVIDGLAEEGRQISKVSASLQRTVSAMRLLSLETLFRRLQRPVRDAARQSGKKVEVTSSGGEVQLDRGLIDALYGPLLHIVRNAVSHGIESPDDRRDCDKPPIGRIVLLAEQRQGAVQITVKDDGRGLDFEAIRRKGERLGLLSETEFQEADRDALAALIFRPGFSTQEQVTDLAGRGVGMDVVASEVEQLRGTVSLESTEGEGTAFHITLPLTSMIDQVLLLRAGENCYALSQAAVESVLCVEPDQVQSSDEGLSLRVGKEALPALALDSPPRAADASLTALLIRCGNSRQVLLVDRIEAQRDAVVRPLGRLFTGHPLFTSATFGGDGQVIFVLDPARLPTLTGQGAAQPEADSAPSPGATASSQASVLWADDSISVRKLAGIFLSAEGWTAETATDGLDALTKLRQGRFQVLVTDLEMPRMHGYELLQEIRADPALRSLPVIVCSSRSSEKHRRRAREAGANGYLTKPFTQEALADALRECLACESAG